MLRHLVVILSMAAFPITARAQRVDDLSGIWRTDPGRTQTLRRVDRGAAHWGPIPYSTTEHPYTIRIVEGSDTIEITYPGGTGNFMNVGAYSFGPDVTSVRNFGEWWAKTLMHAERNEDGVVLRARRLMDWWKDASPADVTAQEAETDTEVVLRLTADRSGLVVDTTLSDEKGQVTYRQVFSRD
jgi:hypothetical protein